MPTKARCGACSGTGKALSSRDVQIELAGFEVSKPSARSAYVGGRHEDGGISVITYQTSAALVEHGIRAVLGKLVER